MNAPARSALLCFAFLAASISPAWADYTAGPNWDHHAQIEPSYNRIAPDYSTMPNQNQVIFDRIAETPEAATIFLAGAGILVIFAGIGIRRGV